MFFKTLVSFALCVTVAQSRWSLFRRNQAPVAPKSETNLQPQGDEQRDLAIIFVSRTSGAGRGGKLLDEYHNQMDKFNGKQLYLFDIQDKESRNAGLAKACSFLKSGHRSNLIVAAAGGDGTVLRVVSLLAKYKDNNSLCFVFWRWHIPKIFHERVFFRHIGLGTENDFAKSSGYTDEFNAHGEYRKMKHTWLDTLENLHLQSKSNFVNHILWETSITAKKITSALARELQDEHEVTNVFRDNQQMKNIKEFALLYLSGPLNGLMPCKVGGLKELRKEFPPLNDYLNVTVKEQRQSRPKQAPLFARRSQKFLLLLGKTFGGGRTLSLNKTFGDSKLTMLAASGTLDLVPKNFTKVFDTEFALHMEFNSTAWENEAQGFASKLEDGIEKVYTIRKDGECWRLEGLTSIDIKPSFRFQVLTYTQ